MLGVEKKLFKQKANLDKNEVGVSWTKFKTG